MTALRQLRHVAHDLSTSTRSGCFADQVESVAMLALSAQHKRAAKLLHGLAARLRLPGGDHIDAIQEVLQSAQLLLAEGDPQ
jgi:hypothetical protein